MRRFPEPLFYVWARNCACARNTAEARMNLRVKPDPAIGKPRPTDQAEQAQRKAAVDYARGSVRLEGFVLAPEVEDLNRRYIAGELTSQQLTDAILALYPA
jgi:hypothetical protein